jgi:hypothetical protein
VTASSGVDQEWLAARLEKAPAALRERVRELVAESGRGDSQASALSVAAMTALRRVMRHPGDRTIALDLLAADGLITLALLAQAGSDPAQLEAFAADLLAAPYRP